MTQVLHVVLSLQPGGAERLVIELCQRLAGEIRSAVCCLDGPGAWAGELGDTGIEVVALHREPGFRPSLARRVAQIAGKLNARVLHCHQYSAFVYGALAQLARPGLRVIVTEHGRLDATPASRRRRMVNRVLNLLPGRVFAVSTELRARLIEEGFPAGRVRVTHNGIEPGPDSSKERRGHARKALALDRDALVIGAVGRLDKVKSYATLITAVGALRHQGMSPRLVILGDGPERAELASCVRATGLDGVVLMPGYRPDVRDLLPAFDLFVNSSVYEGVSLTLLEAMAACLPVIATRVGGTPEVVDDGVTGLLIPAGSVTALEAAARRLLSDARQRQIFGRNGRERVLRCFGIDAMVRRYADVYRHLGAC